MKKFSIFSEDFSLENLEKSYVINKLQFILIIIAFVFISAFSALYWYHVYLDSLSWIELLRYFDKSLI